MKMSNSVLSFKLSAICIGLSLAVTPVQAELLSEILPGLMETDDEISQVEAELEGAQHEIRIKQAGWYPTVDVTLSKGYEDQQKPADDDTMFNRREHKIEVKQLVTDFGATAAGISKAQLQYEKKANDLQAKRQTITITALKAYLNLMKDTDKLAYAKQSEGNIKKQTGMEEARVARGSGYSTDVLQSKSKLAGAYAKTARAEGSLVKARNEYRAVFGVEPGDVKSFRKPEMPTEFLPKTLEEALDMAYRKNTSLRGSNYDVEIARKDIKTAKTKFYPTIKANVDKKFKKDDGGTAGKKNEFKAHFELKMPLYAGGKDLYGLRKSDTDLSAKMEKLDKSMRDVEEKVRNAWQDLITDKTNAGFLRNSANISGEFLTLARKERKLGTRSLIDVLSEENSYITALDSAVSAETDLIISAFELLQEIGTLEVAMVQDENSAASAAPAVAQIPETSALLKTAATVAAKHIASQPEKSGEIDERQQAINEVQEDAEVIADSLNAVIRKMEGARGISQSPDVNTVEQAAKQSPEIVEVVIVPTEIREMAISPQGEMTYVPPTREEQKTELDSMMGKYAPQFAKNKEVVIVPAETREMAISPQGEMTYVPPTREEQKTELDSMMGKYAPQFTKNKIVQKTTKVALSKDELSWDTAYKKMEEAGWITANK